MGVIAWLLIIFVGAPFLFGILSGFLGDLGSSLDFVYGISDKTIKILLIISGVLFVWSLIDISRGSMFFMIIKWLIIIILLLIVISGRIMHSSREAWINKIYNALDGEVGKMIKRDLFNNSYEYIVDSKSITYFKNGLIGTIYFSNYGYSQIPLKHTDIVCQWIWDNIVLYPEDYRIRADVFEFGGTTVHDGYNVKRNFFGDYEVTEKTSYSSGSTELKGYVLTKYNDGKVDNPKNLKKW